VKITDQGIVVLYRYLPRLGVNMDTMRGTVLELRALYIKNSGGFYSFGHIASPQAYYGPDGHSNLIIKNNGEIYTIYQVAHTQGGGGSYDNWGDLTLRYLGNINTL